MLCHNKTLAAQLCAEFREFFPKNAVEYFVSYFDYYQPEAYIAPTDTYIEKDSSINDEIERLRHSATQSLFTRPDTLIVASVSCIFGLGSPSDYMEMSVRVRVGEEIDRDVIAAQTRRHAVPAQRLNLVRGTFRVRGDALEFVGVDEELVHRIEFFGDDIEAIDVVNILTGEYVESKTELLIFPAKHFITPEEKLRRAVDLDRRRTRRAAALFQTARKAARSAALGNAHALRSRHAARSRLLQRHRKLFAPSDRARARVDAVVSDRLLSRKTGCCSSTSRTCRCRRCTACMPATVRARRCWSSTDSGCRARWTTGRSPTKSSTSISAGDLRLGYAGHVRNRPQRASRRDDHSSDRPGRSGSRGAADAQSGRRSHGGDSSARGSARSACW